MYRTYFLNLLIRQLKLCRSLQCLPIEYDPKSRQVVMIQCPKRIRAFRLQSVLSVLYCSVLLPHIILGPLTLWKQCQGLVFLICFFALTLCRWNYDLDPLISHVINSYMDFEENILEGPLK